MLSGSSHANSLSPPLLLRLPYIPLPAPTQCSPAHVQNFKSVTLGITQDSIGNNRTVVISCWGRWSRFNPRYMALLSRVQSRFLALADPPHVIFVFSRWSNVPSSHVNALLDALSSESLSFTSRIPASSVRVLPLLQQEQHQLLACASDVHVDTLPVGGHVTVGDALAGGSDVVTMDAVGMCGRYAASVGFHGRCNVEAGVGRGSNSPGVFVATDDNDAAAAVVDAALRSSAYRRQFLQAQYRRIYEHQQLRYWAQLEAGCKMALDQWHAIRENQQRLHVTNNNNDKQQLHATVIASESVAPCSKS
jgi:hypothetical protein